VLTFDAKEKLLGKTVKPGDPLLRLGWTKGPWEVELFIPEREAGRVREALFRPGAEELNVDLLLTSEPTRIYRGKLGGSLWAGRPACTMTRSSFSAHVTITDPSLLAQMENMPVGVEVRARVYCGEAPAGHVWFNEIWTFLYEKFVF